ncbi:RagB/SusD family nutrient uptake outer membrane protein [Arachidicoccus ginsenosidimutans]|uniref:RagB/SusD family nutrient uptake outer membrane protein n=1 Tax=Arachidicoccus sp. BS20 TaxID=1850526 RepID=UPI000AC1B320|nr:RagB/SusD family nutrient uptake outer membrane protein [Arachidicoccus sp. BS20]
MKIFKLLFSALTIMAIFASCKKFLDINPSTASVNPATIKDFTEMLNSDSLGTGYFFLTDMMTDDINISSSYLTGVNNIYTRVYSWDSTFWNPGDTDIIYNSSYTRILQMNIILSRINDAPKDSLNTLANSANVTSEALINRAWLYLQLANIYGKAYNKGTASVDLAVPLITVPNATNDPSRATVAQVYAQVISDLSKAVDNPYLQAKGANILHPGKAAGYTLLARAYLYEAQYDSAEIYADSSLNLASTLLSYNTAYVQPTQLYDLRNNPEVLFGHVSYDQGYPAAFYGFGYSLSDELVDSLGDDDLRYSKNFTYGNFNTAILSGNATIVMDNSVSVPETMLIKAECLARKGDVSGAEAIIKNIRNNRLQTGAADNRIYNASNILSYVLSERRRELFMHGGLRLFDLKRYNNDPSLKKTIYRYATVTYGHLSFSSISDSLPPGDNKYLVPFSSSIIANNPNIVQNPR